LGRLVFLIRFVHDTFDENSQSTLGIEFLSKVIQTEERRIQLQLWDTAGQEMFSSVTRGYDRGFVRGADLVRYFEPRHL
jgi:GTPase SAR1 family protein